LLSKGWKYSTAIISQKIFSPCRSAFIGGYFAVSEKRSMHLK